GTLVLVRVLNLAELNHQIGHIEVDQILRHIAAEIYQFTQHFTQSHAGRLNGSDFALIVPGNIDTELLANELAYKFAEQLKEYGLDDIALPLAACAYSVGEKRAELMHKLDGALAQAEI